MLRADGQGLLPSRYLRLLDLSEERLRLADPLSGFHVQGLRCLPPVLRDGSVESELTPGLLTARGEEGVKEDREARNEVARIVNRQRLVTLSLPRCTVLEVLVALRRELKDRLQRTVVVSLLDEGGRLGRGPIQAGQHRPLLSPGRTPRRDDVTVLVLHEDQRPVDEVADVRDELVVNLLPELVPVEVQVRLGVGRYPRQVEPEVVRRVPLHEVPHVYHPVPALGDLLPLNQEISPRGDEVRELVLPLPDPHAGQEQVVVVDDVLSDEVVDRGAVPVSHSGLPRFLHLLQGRGDVAEVVVEPPVEDLPLRLLEWYRHPPVDVS